MIWVVMKDARIVLLSNKPKIFVRIGERGLEFTALTYIFFLIYTTTPSVNGFTLQMLSLSVLVLHWILIVPLVWTVVIVHGSLLYADCASQRIHSFITSTHLRPCNNSQCAKSCCTDCYNQLVIACILQFCVSQQQTECQRACHVQKWLHLVRL